VSRPRDGTGRSRSRAAAALLALWLLGCAGGPERELERAAAQTREAEGALLDLAEVVPGDWDRVGVYGPSTPAEVIEGTLGVAAPALAEDRLSRAEAPSLLLFARDERVVSAAYVERDVVDFQAVAPAVYRPEEARFTVREAQGPDGTVRPLAAPAAR
jgi:hypothetical protein